FTLNQVRPISLIEPIKKCLTKIFTTRLDQIINQHHLLSDLNFAATKNSSTHIPIQILLNTIEHYKTNNKEAWILFQDMSKAFDKINIKRLLDACKRIGIPQSGLNFIEFLYQDRKARAITAYGLTNPITLHSGIEQGETYLPLLWKIYYDPILSYINSKYNSKLLKISSQSPLEIIFSTASTHTTIPPLAFMDDTVWHCESKDELQNILDDISELYQLNNIQVNPSKSDLIHITPNQKTLSNILPDTTPLTFNNQPITPRKSNEIIRYLGIFLDGKGSTKPTLNKIFDKTFQFIHTIQYKKLLPIQISRLFNTILSPSIEYLLQICSPPQNKLQQLSSLLTRCTKHMLHLSINTNNDILTNPQLLNTPTLNKLMLQTCSSNIERCFNSNILLNQISIHRTKEWLSKIWKPSLTQNTILKNHRKTTNFTIITQLYHLYKNNIFINNTHLNQLTFHKQTNQLNNIYNFISPNNSTTLSLKNNKILFLEQLLTADNLNLLPWKNIYLRTLKSPRGPTPSWFKILSNQISTFPILHTWPNLQLQPINPFLNTLNLITPQFNGPKNTWTLYISSSNWHIGKITNTSNSQILFQKYQIIDSMTNTIHI